VGPPSAISFSSASIPDVELWAAKGFVNVKESCGGNKVFSIQTHSSAVPPDVCWDVEVPSTMNDLNEDISHVREAGLMVDDDTANRELL